MLYYSVFNCYPSHGMDSVLIFQADQLICSYPFKSDHGAASVEFVNFIYQLEHSRMNHLSRPDAEDIILKMDALDAYRKTKNLITTLMETSQKEDLQIAYRASRNNYIEAVRALESPEACEFELNIRQNKKKEANAIFKVVRRVYEQAYMLDECLPRCFDGLPGETIDALYKQECGHEQKSEGQEFKFGDDVVVNTERLAARPGKVVRIFPAGELCEEIIYQVNYIMVGGNTTAGQFKASELSSTK